MAGHRDAPFIPCVSMEALQPFNIFQETKSPPGVSFTRPIFPLISPLGCCRGPLGRTHGPPRPHARPCRCSITKPLCSPAVGCSFITLCVSLRDPASVQHLGPWRISPPQAIGSPVLKLRAHRYEWPCLFVRPAAAADGAAEPLFV